MNKIFKSFLVFLVFLLNFACSSDNKELATYRDKSFLIKDYKKIIELQYSKLTNRPEQWKKKFVKDTIINEELANLAKSEKMDQEPSVQSVLKLIQGEVIFDLLGKNWEKKQESVKEKIYHVKNILIKTNQFSADQNEAAKNIQLILEKINLIRQEISSKKITFVKAIKSNSEDVVTKKKEGDMGYFPIGTNEDEFDFTLKRISGQTKGTPYRVIGQNVNVYKDASLKEVLSTIDQFKIVVSISNQNDIHNVIFGNDQTGYISGKSLTKVEETKDLSAPFLTRQGWQIIQLLDTQEMNKDDYADLLEDTEFDDKDDADKRAESKAMRFWSKISRNKKMEFENQTMKNYGIDPLNPPALPKNWEQSVELFKNEKITLLGDEFKNFLRYKIGDRDLKTFSEKSLDRIYYKYIQSKIFINEKSKLVSLNEFNEKLKLEETKFLANLYKEKNWLVSLEPTKEEIKAEYDKLVSRRKSMMAGKKANIPSFKEMEERIHSQLLNRKKRMIFKEKEEELEKKIKLKLIDENFEKIKE